MPEMYAFGMFEKLLREGQRLARNAREVNGPRDAAPRHRAAREGDHALGLRSGFGFEVRNNCAAANVGATVAAGLMERDADDVMLPSPCSVRRSRSIACAAWS